MTSRVPTYRLDDDEIILQKDVKFTDLSKQLQQPHLEDLAIMQLMTLDHYVLEELDHESARKHKDFEMTKEYVSSWEKDELFSIIKDTNTNKLRIEKQEEEMFIDE
jgi:hypothetical protein